MKLIKLDGAMLVGDVAQTLKIHPVSVRRLISQGKLCPSMKVGQTWVFEAAEVEKFKKTYHPVSGQIGQKARESHNDS